MCIHAQIVVDFSHSNKLELTKGDFAMPMIEAKVTPETRFMSVILELLTGAGMEVISKKKGNAFPSLALRCSLPLLTGDTPVTPPI